MLFFLFAGERVQNKQTLVNKYMPAVTMTTILEGQAQKQPQAAPEYKATPAECVT